MTKDELLQELANLAPLEMERERQRALGQG
jgi:hypothetical protein